MSSSKKLLQAAAGNAGESLYVDDVFSTYLYTGTGSTKTITNGIDLAGEGGLVWTKMRNDAGSGSADHWLFDTARGVEKKLSTNTTGGQGSTSGALEQFNSNGYQLGYTGGGYYELNNASGDYASWTFREAKKFFDVVVYTGDGVSGRTVAHALGSTPAAMFIKRTSASGDDWAVYHSALGATKLIALNTTSASLTNPWLTDTAPTDSVFTLNNYGFINESGSSYVAYLFASDAGGFGDDGSENIIKCGSYTGNGSSSGPTINLGFEPQWVIIKKTTGVAFWIVVDVMRGMTVSDYSQVLKPNDSAAEAQNNWVIPQASGFRINDASTNINGSGETYIYIAIRRPMKTPESGTEVFAVDKGQDAASGSTPSFISGFPVDLGITNVTIGAGSNSNVASRLLGTKYLSTSSTIAESTNSTYVFDYMTGWRDSTAAYADIVSWMFKRATGFFDVVAYTGNGVARTLAHNLGVAPEMVITKRRDSSSFGDWSVWHEGLADNRYIRLNSSNGVRTGEMIDESTTTTSVFGLTDGADWNLNTGAFIAYLFSTLAGVSKVGSYTGTGADLNVDCGFSAGARFILIKRTDSTGDWYVWDSVRGITAGNDPYILLNTTAAEVTNTDYIDPLNAGFTVTSSAPAGLNANNGTYIFLAIA